MTHRHRAVTRAAVSGDGVCNFVCSPPCSCLLRPRLCDPKADCDCYFHPLPQKPTHSSAGPSHNATLHALTASMLLSKRERPPDSVSTTSNKSSPISYHRTSIPSISPVLVVSSRSPTPSTARRAPLAPLDPQVTAGMSLDDQASAPSSTSASAQSAYSPPDLGMDVDRPLEAARAFIGRTIMPWPQEEDPGLSTQSLRRRSLSGQCVISLFVCSVNKAGTEWCDHPS